jgi:hypothetical protein
LLLHAGLEQGNNLVHCAWVKLLGHVFHAAATDVAGAFEVKPSTVIGRKTEEFKGPDGVGVGRGKPLCNGVIQAGRGDSRPEGTKVGMELGVGPGLCGLGGVAGAVGAAAAGGSGGSSCTAAAPAGAIAVAGGGVALGCGVGG